MMRSLIFTFTFAALLAATPAVAQVSSPPASGQTAPTVSPGTYDQAFAAVMNAGRRVMTAERMLAPERILLDGILDEAPWRRATPAADFIQQDPVLGGPPTERTEVRIVFSRTGLYMGVTCFDSEPDQLLGNTMKRDDFLSADDRFMWTMDTFLDQQTGYFFEMNPSGLMADSVMGTAGDNRNWDGHWNARVRKSEIGWTIELEIPFSTLNFDPNAPAWGINFQRTVRRKNEENLWTGHQRNQGLRRMSNAGLLVGIRGVSQGIGLDLRPYGAASFADSPGRSTPKPLDADGNAGLDLLYNFTPSLRANLTVNTDFAETEVDQRLVNLTRFPLFFAEKRTFFLDGATFFDFYRGGGASPVRPFFSRRIGLDSEGQQQPIDIGGKVTGQVGRQDVGLLLVRTRESDTALGEDFAVMRVKRRFWSQSYLAGIYTGRHLRGGETSSQNTAGVDVKLATSRFRGRQNLELDGFLLWATDRLGVGQNLAYGIRGGFPNDPWSGNVSYEVVEKNHQPALGFLPRAGFRNLNPRLTFSPRPRNHPWIRRLDFSLVADLMVDGESRWLTRSLAWQVIRLETHAQDAASFTIEPQYERLEEDFDISDGIVLPVGAEYAFTRYRIGGNTANRRKVAAQTSYAWGGFFSGTRRQVNLNVNLRPRPGVRVQLEGEWNDVHLAEGSFKTQVYRLISDTQFSPWMFVVNNIQFDTVSRVLGWQGRFRWTFTPGNDLFFIYTHNWRDDITLDRVVTLDRRAATKFVYTHRF